MGPPDGLPEPLVGRVVHQGGHQAPALGAPSVHNTHLSLEGQSIETFTPRFFFFHGTNYPGPNRHAYK
jgi:hypothetical protein